MDRSTDSARKNAKAWADISGIL